MRILGFFAIFALAINAAAAETYVQQQFVDTPVASYAAAPVDQNFIPATEFMLRADSVNQDANIQDARQNMVDKTGQALQFANRPAVICRTGNCSRLNDRITRTYLFNTLSNLFMLNSHSKMSICEADPFSRSCLQSGISFPASVGIANAMIKMPRASISQVSVSTGLSQTKLALSYFVLVNGMETQCQATTAELMIPNEGSATLVSRNFSCALTHDGTSNVSLMLNIDYIDLDFGILGGYYSLGMQGPAQGGGTGYALMKMEFTNSAAQKKPVSDPTMESNLQYENGSDDAFDASSSIQSIREGEVRVKPLDKNASLE